MYKNFKITSILGLLAIVGTTSSMNRSSVENGYKHIVKGVAKTLTDVYTFGVPALGIGLSYWANQDKYGIRNFDLIAGIKFVLPLSLCGAAGTLIKNSLPDYKTYNSGLRTILDHPYVTTICAGSIYGLLKHRNSCDTVGNNFVGALCAGTGVFLSTMWAQNYLEDHRDDGKIV